MDRLFLKMSFEFRNAKTCQVHKVLACDLFVVDTVFMVATKTYARWVSFRNYITNCINKADGLLEDENSLRELIYESLYQWCDEQMAEPINVGFMDEANGKAVAEACYIVTSKLLRSSPRMRNLFSGEKLTLKMVMVVRSEAVQFTEKLKKEGLFVMNTYLFLLRAALGIQERHLKM